MNQAQAMSAPILKIWSDGLAMAMQSLEASQAHSKKILESAFEVSAAAGKDCLSYADEARARVTRATGNANELVKEQAALLNDMARDPAGAGQRAIAAWAEGSRKSLEMGVEALKSYAGLMDTLWSRMEKAGHDARRGYMDYVNALQGIVEAQSKTE
jgi:hypothetical protein